MIATARQGKTVYALTTGNALVAWNYAEKAPEKRLFVANDDVAALGRLRVSADGNWLAAAVNMDDRSKGAVLLLDLRSDERREPAIIYDSWVSEIAFSPEGRRLATGSWAGRVSI